MDLVGIWWGSGEDLLGFLVGFLDGVMVGILNEVLVGF